MTTIRRTITLVAIAALASAGIAACGDDTDTPAAPTTPGAPSFTSFTVSSPVPCQDGNASVDMSFATRNVVSIEIRIGDGGFESTAGYGPNESSVVASIPCSGPSTSSVQLRGCTENDTCADSATETVEITG